MRYAHLIIIILGLNLYSCVKWDLEKFPLNTFSEHYPISPSPDTQLVHQFIQITDGTFRIIGTNTKQQISLLQVSSDGKSATVGVSPGVGKANDIQNGMGQNAFGVLLLLKEGLTFIQYVNGTSPTLQTLLSHDLSKKFPLIESSEGINCTATTQGNWIVSGILKQATQSNRLFVSSLKAVGTSEWIHTYETNIRPVGTYVMDNGTLFLLGSKPDGNAILLRFQNNGTLTLSKSLNNIFISKEGGISGNGKSIFITASQKTLKGYKTLVTSLTTNGEKEWEYTKESTFGVSTGIRISSEKEGLMVFLEREGNITASLQYSHRLIKLNSSGEVLWESSFAPEKPFQKITDLIISSDFGYALLGIDPTGYSIIKTDVFGKIKP